MQAITTIGLDIAKSVLWLGRCSRGSRFWWLVPLELGVVTGVPIAALPVCTENSIRIDWGRESPKHFL